MNTRSETYERILQVSDELFVRFGPMRTPVVEIARTLGMSPANVYKFFPTKSAIIEAVGERHMQVLRQRLRQVIATRKSAWDRIEDLIREVAEYFNEIVFEKSDQLQLDLMQDMLEFEMRRRQNNWQFSIEFEAFLKAEIAALIRSGIAAGEMRACDPADAAGALLDCLLRAIKPFLMAADTKPERAQRLARQFRLLSRALKQ
jgi:AcrR family transcriptional regulator